MKRRLIRANLAVDPKGFKYIYEVYKLSFTLTNWKNYSSHNSNEEKLPLATIKNAPCLTLLCWSNVFILERSILNKIHSFPFEKVSVWATGLKTWNLHWQDACDLFQFSLGWIDWGIHLNRIPLEVPSDVCDIIVCHQTMYHTSKDGCCVC